MAVLFSCWLAGACVALIWCSLRASEGVPSFCAGHRTAKAGLEYITISSALLEEWAVRDEHLIIMDLRPATQAEGDFESIPGSLRITPGHLRSYFRYLPPRTTLVLYGKAVATRLEAEAENLLLKTGIQAVYILEETAASGDACANHVAWVPGSAC